MVKLTPFAKAFITCVILAVLALATNHYLSGGLRGLLRGGERQATGSAASNAAATDAAPSPGSAGAPPAPILHLAGSNTVGAKLAPALVQAWLRRQGIDSTVEQIGTDETLVAGGDRSVLVSAHGTKTGFEALRGREADVAMASRPIRADEAADLGGLAAMTAGPSEHVLALDGVAVIVNPANPLRSLERGQLADIFSGRVIRWSDLGGNAGAIHVNVRDQSSGTTDIFVERVLRGGKLLAGARSFDSNAALAREVAIDPAAIGYVSFAEIGDAQALAVSESGTLPIRPNRLTVSKEQYLLSRRLFLYTTPSPSPVAADFVRFALSDDGQAVVDQVGFVGQRVEPAAPTTSIAELAGAPAEYRAFVTGARTLPFSFRFRSNSAQLDTKGAKDLERLVAYVASRSSEQVLLFGFADGSGAAAANRRLSQQRASSVADELRREGVEAAVVRGFGATLFVDSNDTPEGRERNRRVEVWVR
ncbi:MAG TPA: phosphate ABC transporter substrate-binding/OmpA family protein [Thermoanaerobaculia bacterium]|nr:phosphate ABC transporter substrate-binding/OmpA family protein [Thermoanaerobaculia bacterium]